MDQNDIENYVRQSLVLGDPREKVVTFMEKEKWVYSFNRHTKSFQARDPEEDKNKTKRHQILIHLDEFDRYKGVTVNVWRHGL